MAAALVEPTIALIVIGAVGAVVARIVVAAIDRIGHGI
jgi:hypothetical protein